MRKFQSRKPSGPRRSTLCVIAAFALPLLIGSKTARAELPTKLPADLKWETNDTDQVLGSPEAKPGGTLHEFLLTFPPTLRVVGPDSNHSFRGAILDNHM